MGVKGIKTECKICVDKYLRINFSEICIHKPFKKCGRTRVLYIHDFCSCESKKNALFEGHTEAFKQTFFVQFILNINLKKLYFNRKNILEHTGT